MAVSAGGFRYSRDRPRGRPVRFTPRVLRLSASFAGSFPMNPSLQKNITGSRRGFGRRCAAFVCLTLATIGGLGAAVMTDQQLFGVWNGSSWTTASRIKYSYSSALAPVETAVKAGDYTTAKSALLTYFKNRTGFTVPVPVAKPDIVTLTKDLTFMGPASDKWVNEVSVTGTAYSVKSIDVLSAVKPKAGKGVIGFMLMGKTKPQPVQIYIASRETSTKPTLHVVLGAQTWDLVATKDTFVQPTITTPRGSVTQLNVRASGFGSVTAGYDSGETRSYFVFDLSSLPQGAAFDSATLKLSMATNSGVPTDHAEAYVFDTPDTSWDEATKTWAFPARRNNIFSWQGVTSGVPWTTPDSTSTIATDEYLNVVTRFDFVTRLAADYLSTPATASTIASGALAIDLMVDFANKTAPGFQPGRSIDVGLRLAQWITAYHHLRSSGSTALTPDEHATIIKRFWEDANEQSKASNYHTDNNHGILETVGFFQTAIYFPEFVQSASWETLANTRVLELLDLLTFSDDSTTEASTGYGLGVVVQFANIKKFSEDNGRPMSVAFNDSLRAFAYYAMHQTDPLGYDIQYGDTDFIDRKPDLRFVGGVLGDNFLLWVGTRPDASYTVQVPQQGTQPTETSSYYNIGRLITQRSDWSQTARFLTFQSGLAKSHGHPDTLAVTLHAYGRPLLVDAGRMSYDNNDPISVWIRTTTNAHNMIRVANLTLSKGGPVPGDSSTTPQGVSKYVSNAGFEFATAWHQGYPNFTNTRSVLFVKPAYWIVSDTCVPTTSGTNTYDQFWHFTPDAFPTTPDSSDRVKTTYASGGNLQVVPADPTTVTATLENGWYSRTEGSAEQAKYIQYRKVGPGTMTYDTVLYPTNTGETRNVTVVRLGTSPSVTAATATSLKIDLNNGASGDLGYYYLSKESTPSTRAFDPSGLNFSSNARLVYVQTSSTGAQLKKMSVADCTSVTKNGTTLVTSPSSISSLDVVWNGTTLAINGRWLNASTNQGTAIGIYAPGVTSVTLNGNPVSFSTSGNLVYAVVAVPPS